MSVSKTAQQISCFIDSALTSIYAGWSPVWSGWFFAQFQGLNSPTIPAYVKGSSFDNPYVVRMPSRIQKNWAGHSVKCTAGSPPGVNVTRGEGSGAKTFSSGPCAGTPDFSWKVTLNNLGGGTSFYDPKTQELVIQDVYNFQKTRVKDYQEQYDWWVKNTNVSSANSWAAYRDGIALLDIVSLGSAGLALDIAGAARKRAAGIEPNRLTLPDGRIITVNNLDGLQPTYHEYRISLCNFKKGNRECYDAYVANKTIPDVCCKDDDLDKNLCGGDPFENENPCE